MYRLTRRDVLICLSLANVSLLEVWRRMVFANPFLLPQWTWRDLLAAAVVLAALTAVFCVFLVAGRTTRLRLVALDRWIFVVPIVVFLDVCWEQFPWMVNRLEADPVLRIEVALLSSAAVLIFARFHRWTGKAAEMVALCLLPFLPLMFLQASWIVLHQPPKPALAGPVAAAAPAPNRFVWIVYDEADWRYIDPASRPARLALPELDRLMSGSVWADNAIQSGLQTSSAIPSLIYGESVAASFAGMNGRIVSVDERNTPPKLTDPANIFAWVRQERLNGSIVGWYIPYCRFFAPVLSKCYWYPFDSRVDGSEPSLAASLGSVVRSLWPLHRRQRHIDRYRRLLRKAIEDANDPTLSLALLHLPVPHEPAIYDRNSDRLTIFNFRQDWYLDNLVLADRALGDIRRAMEASGMWDKSTVLVTSDHALRWYAGWNEQSSPRIPYIVKLPGQKSGVQYRHRFHTLATHDLIEACLSGNIHTPAQLVSWLDRRSQAVAHPVAASAAPLPGR